MGRPRMAIGECGTLTVIPQHTVQGKWVKAPDARSAQRWEARQLVVGYDGGAPVPLKARAGTKRAAEQALNDKREDFLRSGETARLSGSTPLADAGQMWLAYVAEPGRDQKSAGTLRDYTYSWTRYAMSPTYGLAKYTLAQANDVQRIDAFQRKVVDGPGPGALKMVRTVLGQVLNYAVSVGAITENVLPRTSRPNRTTPKVTHRNTELSLTVEEQERLLVFAYQRASVMANPRSERKARACADMLATMSGTGMRIAEAVGLRWEWINLDTGIVEVNGTKSWASSLRRVTLPLYVLALLRKRAALTGTDGYVFASPGVSDPEKKWDQSNNSKVMRLVFDGAGLPWATSHSLRKTAVTRLVLDAGMTTAEVAVWIGHKGTATLERHYLKPDRSDPRASVAAHLELSLAP